MGRLFIECPKTKLPLFTGMGMDRRSFEDPTKQISSMGIGCPHCRATHQWSKEVVIYVPDEGEQGQTTER